MSEWEALGLDAKMNGQVKTSTAFCSVLTLTRSLGDSLHRSM